MRTKWQPLMATKKSSLRTLGRTSETALFYALKHSGKCNYNITYVEIMVKQNYFVVFLSILQILDYFLMDLRFYDP